MTSYGSPKFPRFVPTTYKKVHTQDPVVDRVIDLFIKRSDEGMIKYQTTMEDNPAAKLEWINHAQQEAMDFILYLERLKKEVK